MWFIVTMDEIHLINHSQAFPIILRPDHFLVVPQGTKDFFEENSG